MANEIIMPKYLGEQFRILAEIRLKNNNIPITEKNVQAIIQELANEAFNESFTPGVDLLGKNPSAQIATDIFDLIGVKFVGFVKGKSTDTDSQKRLIKLFRASVSSIANIFLELELGLHHKDFAYPKYGGKSATPDEARRTTQVELNRWKRLFVQASILSLLYPLFRLSRADVTNMFRKLNIISDKTEIKNLQSNDERKKFVIHVMQSLNKKLSKYALTGEIIDFKESSEEKLSLKK